MFSKEQLERLDGTSEKEGLLSVNTLQDEKAMEGYHKVHDAFNYDKEGNFIGFNGSNFGVQMVFDQEKKRAPVPIQTIQGIETALSTAGRMDMLDSILGPFYKATRNNFNRRFDSRTTNVNDLSEYVLSRANKVLIDPNQRYLLEQSGPSILHPGVSEFTKNQVKKDAIQSGNNLVGHGSILQQKSAAIVKIGNLRIPDNRGFRLRSYRTVNTIRNSIREKVVMPVEGILPKFMEDSHRARKYFASKESMKNELFQ